MKKYIFPLIFMFFFLCSVRVYTYKLEGDSTYLRWLSKKYSYFINSTGVDNSVDYSSLNSVIQDGIEDWQVVSTADFLADYKGTTTDEEWCGVDGTNGQNSITWKTNGWSGSVIGTCSYFYYPSTGEIIEADIKLNTSFSNDPRMELLVMHEAGHGIGIGHTKENGESATTEEDKAVMHWELDSKTAANCHDFCAVTAIYPKSASCSPNNTPGVYHDCIGCCSGTNAAPTAAISSVSPNPAYVGAAVTVKATGNDADGDQVQLKIDWDDGPESSYSTLQASGSTFTFTKSYTIQGTYDIRVKPKDDNGKEGSWSSSTSLTVSGSSGSPTISLNRSQIYFGATTTDNSTSSQTFSISNSGGGTLNWSVSDDKNWLSSSPTSGSGFENVSVSVNPSGLSAGTYTGTITVSDPNAANSPQTVSVTLMVYNSNLTSVPFGQYSTPIDGSTVSSSIAVTGWALDDIEVKSVKIYSGQIYIGDAVFVEGARSDVEQAYPTYPWNYRAGWGYMLLTNFLPGGGNGVYTLNAIAADAEGNQVTLGSKTITVDNANAVKPFGAIDSPGQGGTVSGSSFKNMGWALTPLPNKIPEDGSTIKLYIDGVLLGNAAVYNIYRTDIANYFPGYANSGGAAVEFTIDTTAFTNGIHSIYWIVTDDAGNKDGIGSRFFKIQNTGSAKANKAMSQAVSHSMHQVMNFPVDCSMPVKVKQGFNENAVPRTVHTNEKGISRIVLRELERIEIQLVDEGSVIYGYMLAGCQLRPLPIGSTLNAGNGKFLWQPGPGFVGEYRLIFVLRDQHGNIFRKNLTVDIMSKFSKQE